MYTSVHTVLYTVCHLHNNIFMHIIEQEERERKWYMYSTCTCMCNHAHFIMLYMYMYILQNNNKGNMKIIIYKKC